MRSVFLDLETTGLDAQAGHKIIEIGAVAFADNEPIAGERGQLHLYVQPERDIDPEASKVHGLTKDDLKGKPIFAAIAEEVRAFIAGADLHAHNASFDVSFLDAEFAATGYEPVKKLVHKVTDTLGWAKRLFPERSNSLDMLALRAGIDVKERRRFHSAIEDAKILAEIYFHFSAGQSTLDLRAGDVDPARLPDPASIERHLLATDATTLKLHAAFVSRLEEISGVKQLLSE